MRTTDRAESVTSSGGSGVRNPHAGAPLTPGRIGRPGNYILSSAEQQVYALHVAGVPSPFIAKRLQMSYSAVRCFLTRAKQRLRGARATAYSATRGPKRYERDAGWQDRQIAYLLTVDDDRAAHYLNGIQIVWGDAVRADVERGMALALRGRNCKENRVI